MQRREDIGSALYLNGNCVHLVERGEGQNLFQRRKKMLSPYKIECPENYEFNALEMNLKSLVDQYNKILYNTTMCPEKKECHLRKMAEWIEMVHNQIQAERMNELLYKDFLEKKLISEPSGTLMSESVSSHDEDEPQGA